MDIQEKMRLIAEKENKIFQERMKKRKSNIENITKNNKKIKKGFKLFGNIESYIEKNKKGNEMWKLRTTFTSNKPDVAMDITSKKAIEKAIKNLDLIPIRFEHKEENYGVWDTFKTVEKDGVIYGVAEGELDQNLNRSKDLWYSIQKGTKFATSYGGRYIDFHYFKSEKSGKNYRIFDEIVIEEISITTSPANPDTALERLNKYAKEMEKAVETVEENNKPKEDIKEDIKEEKENPKEKKDKEEKSKIKLEETSIEVRLKDIQKNINESNKKVVKELTENFNNLLAQLSEKNEFLEKRLSDIENKPVRKGYVVKEQKTKDNNISKNFPYFNAVYGQK